RAAELLYDYITRFGDSLSDRERAEATYRLGESYRQAGDPEGAITTLRQAAELDPLSSTPLSAWALAYEEQGRFLEALRAKTDHLDLATGDARVTLLIEIGDLYASKVGDRNGA